MRRAVSLWHKRAGVAIPRLDPRHRGGPSDDHYKTRFKAVSSNHHVGAMKAFMIYLMVSAMILPSDILIAMKTGISTK